MVGLLVRSSGAAFLLVVVLVAGARLNGRGENPYLALTVYGRYLPGNPVQANALETAFLSPEEKQALTTGSQ